MPTKLAGDVPVVVMLGSCGHGKSTVVEKMTGLTGLSSTSPLSFTSLSSTYRSRHGLLQVTDTPGTDAIPEGADGKMKSSLQIASALSSFPVTLIMVVVKAETRIDAVISQVRKFSVKFSEFAQNLAVCVTHMDEVKWSEELCSEKIKNSLDLGMTVYTRLNTTGQDLVNQTLALCKKTAALNITIDSSNFLKYFEIHDSHRAIFRTVKDEVDLCGKLVRSFYAELTKLAEADRADAVFEFQAFMKDEIDKACLRLTVSHNLETALMSTHAKVNALGHIASLKSQLKSVLMDVRRLAQEYQSEAKVSDLRKCPHCGQIWALVRGCPDTTCGKLVKAPDARRNAMATFTFEICDQAIIVKHTGLKQLQAQVGKRSGGGVGCGNRILWDEMRPVQPPREAIVVTDVTVDDVKLVDEWRNKYWLDWFGIHCAKEEECDGIAHYDVSLVNEVNELAPG